MTQARQRPGPARKKDQRASDRRARDRRLESRRPGGAEDPARGIPTRVPLVIGFLALVALLGGFGAWSATTQIASAVIAPGRIEVERNRQVIQHPEGGVVAELLVSEGDRVAAGEVLLRLDPGPLGSDLAIVEGELFELMARRGRLEAERDGHAAIAFADPALQAARRQPEVAELLQGQERLLVTRRVTQGQAARQMRERIIQIESQIAGLEAQLAAMDRQLVLVERELTTQRTLMSRGLSQAARVLALEREEARLQGQLGDLTARKAEARGRIAEHELEILRLSVTTRQEAIAGLRDQQYRELELIERRRALVRRMEELTLRAPAPGLVYGLEIFAPRSVLRPAEPVLYIVPDDRPLVIAARIDPIHIDALYLGQEAVLRFSAFNQRTTPELQGRLTRISADAFLDEATGRAHYEVQISLDEGEVAKLPEGLTLIPGMPVEAFLRTADHTPLVYLVKPMMDYFAKAFREE